MERLKNVTKQLIIAALGIALVGIGWEQWRLVNNSMELSNQLFRQQVNEALANVSRKLEDVEHVADAVTISSRQEPQSVESPSGRLPRIPAPTQQLKPKQAEPKDSMMAVVEPRHAVPGRTILFHPSTQTHAPTHSVPAGNSQSALIGNTLPKNAASSDPVSTSTTSSLQVEFGGNGQGFQLQVNQSVGTNGVVQEQRYAARTNHVQSWDSALKHLSGNRAARYSEVQDNINQALQSMQQEQFVMGQQGNADYSAFRPTLTTGVEFAVLGNSGIVAPQNYGAYSVAVGDTSQMHHRAVPILHTKELCKRPHCSLCAQEKNQNAPASTSARNELRRSEECTARIKDKMQRIQQTVSDLREFTEPLESRVNQNIIDSMIASEFSIKSLPLDYGFGVLNGENNHFVYTKNATREQLAGSPFSSVLFAGDIMPKNHKLFVEFPHTQSYLYKQNMGTLAMSVLFVLMIVGSFGWTMRNLNRHKAVSEMKSDFINNMTHEFKTPIATIALASEALRDPEVSSSYERVSRFIGVIREENRRLSSQVERVLQAAKLDRGELVLTKSDVDMHEVVEYAKDSIMLQVEARGGQIVTDLQASYAVVVGDDVHLRNILLNLMDNAIKYTKDTPHIVVSSRTTNEGIVLSVQDNGIGISKENQKRVFEKLYRVPTGNVHNVKGFGLGLSYVKAIVEAHGGSVSIESEIGSGSRFDVMLPYGVAS